MSKKFIHIAFDSIFLDYTIGQFEAIIPSESQYIIDVPNTEYKIKHIKNVEKISSIVLSEPKVKASFIQNLTSDHIVILHCLNQNMIDIVNKVALDIKFVWFVWGAEVNSLPRLSKNNYQFKTIKLLNKLNNYSYRNRLYKSFPTIKYLSFKLKNGKIHPELEKIKALQRINYAGIFVKEDFDIFDSAYHFNLKWLWYCYYNIDDTIGEMKFSRTKKRINILVGNSSDPRNNHIEAFDLLKRFDIGTSQVICPLSYGTIVDGYVDNVIHIGKRFFANNFLPLIEFMSLKDYNEIIGTCNIVIFNHNIQQAVGNIISSLALGAKVYLNNSNPLLLYFKRLGINIYSIQDDLVNENKEALLSLNDNLISQNQQILKRELSKERVYTNTQELISQLNNL